MVNLLCSAGWDNFVAGWNNFWLGVKTFFEGGFGKILLFILVAILGYILIRLVMKFIKKWGSKTKIDRTVFNFLSAIIKFVLYLLYVLTLLSIIGVPITSLVAIVSAVTLGITLAIQGSVSNIANGIIILANKPFKIDDFVDIGGVTGTVIDINMFNTKLRTPNNEIVTIPHNITIGDPITDFTGEEKRRFTLDISVSYESDVEKTTEVLKQVLAENSLVLQGENNSVNLAKMNTSSIDFSVKVWVATENYWDCYYSVTKQIFTALKENDIEIPYNKLDVFIKNQDNNTPKIEK